MATPSRLDDVITSLVALFDAATTAQVIDGPTPVTPDADFILVGSTGDADEDAATVERDWSAMGNRWIEETGEVVCSIWAQSGDTDLSAQRTRLATMFAACEAALLTDPTLGGLLFRDPVSIPVSRLRQQQTTAGAVVHLIFTVRFQALLN